MPQPKTHVFICTNGRPDQLGKCNSKGSETLHAQVKAACQNLGPDLRINKSGCLGQCESGITSVIYPEGQWHLELTQDSSARLAEIIKRVHCKDS